MSNNTNPMPKVTIAVAVYKVEDYIEECARSLFEQTLDDLEIIFVDDASPDKSVSIIEQTLTEYPNRQGQVQIIRHEQNKGISVTRKDGLDAAHGEYFTYVDSDDWTEPNYAELLYARAKETDADVVVCNFYLHRPNGCFIQNEAPHGEGKDGETLREDSLNRQSRHTLCIRLVRRSIFTENPFVWPPSNMAEDQVISVQTAYYAEKMAHVNVPLYHYRYNTNSYTRTRDEKTIVTRVNSYIENYTALEKFMKEKNIAEKYGKGLFITKIGIRNQLLPIIRKPKYWWKFLNTFPEINWIFLFGNKYHKPTWRERLWILGIMMGLYPRFHKYMMKYCLPGKDWRT